MKIINTKISDVKIIKPIIHKDNRGFFIEVFNEEKFQSHFDYPIRFVQDNQSFSKKNTLRGLHYQKRPYSQAKLVQVICGSIYDVVVDLRKQSKTYGHWFSIVLNENNHHQLWIPEGFAHGFLVLSKNAHVSYKTTQYYHPQAQQSIIWNDPTLNITWPISSSPILSQKDIEAPLFKEIDTGF